MWSAKSVTKITKGSDLNDEELEEVLITSDLGINATSRLIESITASRFNKEITSAEIKDLLATEIAKILKPVAVPLQINNDNVPHVIIVCGVNGVGKTTTIGKLAQFYKSLGKKVILAAGDTFRAAAIEQLKIWGERTNCPVITSEMGKDPASLAFEAYQQARGEQADILLIDTAGRLQNKKELMAEDVHIKVFDENSQRANTLIGTASISMQSLLLKIDDVDPEVELDPITIKNNKKEHMGGLLAVVGGGAFFLGIATMFVILRQKSRGASTQVGHDVDVAHVVHPLECPGKVVDRERRHSLLMQKV